MRGLPSILSLLRNKLNKFNKTSVQIAMGLINSIDKSKNVRFYLSYDIKIALKSHFCNKNVIIL